MFRRLLLTLCVAVQSLAFAGRAVAVEKGSERVSPFQGSFSTSVPIRIPGAHGETPGVALVYSSEGGNGFAGVGWALAGGGSVIERVNSGLGSPRWTSSDTYVLDGAEMIPCGPGISSPSCLPEAGGTHTTKVESYQRIRFDAGANKWTVTRPDGVRTVYAPLMTTGAGTLRWGQESTIDTKGNTASYAWSCPEDGQCYPASISYAGYSVVFYREPRPDWTSFGTWNWLRESRYRLRSVFVMRGSSPIRAYRLQYGTSGQTSRSQLVSVTEYGRDVTHDGAGLISGGTSLPPTSFTYTADPSGTQFVEPRTAGGATTALEPVMWADAVNTTAAGAGNTLVKTGGVDGGWTDAGAVSTRALGGPGYVEFRAGVDGQHMIGLSRSSPDNGWESLEFSVFQYPAGLRVEVYESGVMKGQSPYADGDVIRIQAEDGVIRYKRNGTTFYQSLAAPSYPLLVDTTLSTMNVAIRDVVLSGPLVNARFWCSGATVLAGDFTGDGRTDQLCYTNLNGGTTWVAPGSGAGLGSPSVWLTGQAFSDPVLGDFNGDGKTDIGQYGFWAGDFVVALSTGSTFGAPTNWGTARGIANGYDYACRVEQAQVGTGDMNGDGLTDVTCRKYGSQEVFVGLSTGSSFQFSIFGQLSCDAYYERTGTMDVNSDGRDDWYCIGQNGAMQVYVSEGDRFVADGGGTLPGFCPLDGYMFGDYNGDGKTDAWCRSTGAMALSTGTYLAPTSAGAPGGWCNNGGENLFAADVDGDGASELVCSTQANSSADILVRRWRQPYLLPAETWKAGWCLGQVLPGDYNGDGRTDLACASLALPVVTAGSKGAVDRLKSVANGIGGLTTVTYGSSVQFPNTNNPGAKQVVLSVTEAPGGTTTYSYRGGYMDREERRFLGFAEMTTSKPCVAEDGLDPVCPVVTTRLSQNRASAGQPTWVMVQPRPGAAALTLSEYFYTTNGNTVPRRSTLTAEAVTRYDDGRCPACTPAVSRTAYEYDFYGNRISTRWIGDEIEELVGDGGDVVIKGDGDGGKGGGGDVPPPDAPPPTGPPARDEILRTWAVRPNLAAFIVDRVAREETFDGPNAGRKLQETRFRYDGANSWESAPTAGIVSAVEGWLDREARYVTRTFTSDAWGNRTAEIDETGRITSTTYDSTHHLYAETKVKPGGESETTAWDTSCALSLSVTDAAGQATTYQYDPLCRRTRMDAPLGLFETRSYEVGSIRIETPSASPTDGQGNDWKVMLLDGAGRVRREERRGPAGGAAIRVDRTYDALGGLSAITAPHYASEPPVTTFHAYDALGRPTRVRLQDGTTTSVEYRPRGRVDVDPHGHRTEVATNAFGMVSERTESIEGRPVLTRYRRDGLGRLVELRDSLSNAWRWHFDSLGREYQTEDPDSGALSRSFDDAGRLLAETNAVSQTKTYTYDAGGRLQRRAAADEEVTYVYGEPRGGYVNQHRLTSMLMAGRNASFDYDALGRVVRATQDVDGVTYQERRRFDAAGRLLGITFPDGEAVGTEAAPMTYDAAGRLTAVPGLVTAVAYDAAGRPLQQTNANGTTTVRAYAPSSGGLRSIVTTSATGSIQDLHYDLDEAGVVQRVTSSHPGETWEYEYDGLHRLRMASNLDSPALTQMFGFDDLGRMTSNSAVGDYTYSSSRPHGPDTVAGQAMSYNAAGQLVSGRGRNITWDASGRPAAIDATTFRYGPSGSRLSKASNGVVTAYPLGDDYEVRNGVLTKYIRVAGLGLVAKKVGSGESFWFHVDRVGSVHAITDASGAVVQRRQYRPFGEKAAESSSHYEAQGFIGERLDDETGVTYLHARYYDSQIGVFLSADPSHPTGPGVGLNRYAYGGMDPIGTTDRSGLAFIGCSIRLSEKDAKGCLPHMAETVTTIGYVPLIPYPVPGPIGRNGVESGDGGDRNGGGGGGSGGGGNPPGGGGPAGPGGPTQEDECAVSWVPTGVVGTVGVSGEYGTGDGGIAGQWGAQGYWGYELGLGVQQTAGGVMYSDRGTDFEVSEAFPGSGDPSVSDGSVAGASAGAGWTLGVTNARSPSDLAGRSRTYNVNAFFVSVQVTVSKHDAGYTYTASMGPAAKGASFSTYDTITTAPFVLHDGAKDLSKCN